MSKEEKDQVVQAYKQNKPDTRFKVTYEVDPAILGGLQIYAGSNFLDCSLRSRLQKLKSELAKMWDFMIDNRLNNNLKLRYT